jgi:hypothetical protein
MAKSEQFNSWNFGLHDMESYFCANIDYDDKKDVEDGPSTPKCLFYY